jgi:alpha-galactosidase
VALFNRSDDRQTLQYFWKDLGLNDREYRLRDLWKQRDMGRADSIQVNLPPHGSGLYSLKPIDVASH